LVYNGKAWSFDALFEAGDRGAVVKDGKIVSPIVSGTTTKIVADPSTGDWSCVIQMAVLQMEGLQHAWGELDFYFYGLGGVALEEGVEYTQTFDETTGVFTINLNCPKATLDQIQELLDYYEFEGEFSIDSFGKAWEFRVYSLTSIAGGVPGYQGIRINKVTGK